MRTSALGASAGAAAAVALLSAAALGQEIQPLMGDPLPGLTPAQVARFGAGRVAFDRVLNAADGLGPIMNDHSCASCHQTPRVGGSGAKLVARFGNSGPPFDPLENLGGSLLQAQMVEPQCQEFIPPEADIVVGRITTSTFGSGLIQAIKAVDIMARETAPPPGVSGRAHRVHALEDPPTARPKVGRFGWKAQQPTLLSFSADASLNELGFTNRFLVAENAPNGNQQLLKHCDHVSDPEDGPDAQGFHGIDRQTDFQKFLAPPPQTPRNGMPGEALFLSVGCASCHVAAYVTGPAEPPLGGRAIRPYSDFLIHDMGTLGDGIVQGDAHEAEMRTPALWGLRARATIGLLHDGRATGGSQAQNVLTAIADHDGEALAARTAFTALPILDQDRVVRFLLSLGRPEFDQEGDFDVDDFDWFFLEANSLFTGPGPVFTPDDPAAVADFDQDGDFDLVDFTAMQRAMTGNVPLEPIEAPRSDFVLAR
jgi:cytochrome c551/c552